MGEGKIEGRAVATACIQAALTIPTITTSTGSDGRATMIEPVWAVGVGGWRRRICGMLYQ
jgi:hypothetical protein